MVKILVKKFDKNIKLPAYKTFGSSGMDLMAYLKGKIVMATSFFTYDITDTTATADGNTGTLNGLEITLASAVESSATNYVGIKINVNTVADFFYGGYFKIVKIQ